MRGSEITRVALLKTLSPLIYKAERLLTDYPLRYSSGYRSSVVPLQLLSRPICIQAESHLSIGVHLYDWLFILNNESPLSYVQKENGMFACHYIQEPLRAVDNSQY